MIERLYRRLYKLLTPAEIMTSFTFHIIVILPLIELAKILSDDVNDGISYGIIIGWIANSLVRKATSIEKKIKEELSVAKKK